jgi:two-component system, chemotaxis family, CheB/CheR fusion protein
MEPKKTPGYSGPNATPPIVGIGASAGGLYALGCFLNALPKEFGFVIVFLQHLSPKHRSHLSELLTKGRPHLEVLEIADGMEALPGKLFICPPGKEINIHKGFFYATNPQREHVHLPIDEFFISLAEEAEDRAIAVILSGAGTDGARGIQAIRSAGGTVFVQDPSTAEFPGMPLAAFSTGKVDEALKPEDIAREIVKLVTAGTVGKGRDDVVSAAQFDTFFRLIREKTGYRFNHYKQNVVNRRIRRRMYLNGVASVQDYIQVVTDKEQEAAALATDLMIGVTSFFRDQLAWKALKVEVIRHLVSNIEDTPIRVWTPACASGEESYSIAMLLHHELDLAGRNRDFQVFATDVNDRALEKAREGRFPGSIAADIPADLMRKYFIGSEDGQFAIISKELRERVVFAKQDLMTDPPFSRLDLIICRNFLIYLEPDAQEKSIALFHYALKEGGYLFLGNAESTGRNSALFKSVGNKKCRVFRKLERTDATRYPLSVPFAGERALLVPSRQMLAAANQPTITEFIQNSLLEEYAPAAIAINQNYDILYHNGPTSRYLHQPRGLPTQNLLLLLPENLRSRVRGAIYRAGKEANPVSIRVSFMSKGEQPSQSLPGKRGSKSSSPSKAAKAGGPSFLKGGKGEVQSNRTVTLRISKLQENIFLVVFREKHGAPLTEEPPSAETESGDEIVVRQLESELSATRVDLQSNIEQLKGLNEELQSSNEELQAANEELETSREELQSLNEELLTVNTQLQAKIEEQDATNNDLNNFLTSTNIPTILLDTRFRVKRFTAAMSKLLKLIPSDIGRPIVDMSQENLGSDLIVDAQSVLEQLVPLRQEFKINGTSYVRTTLPYRTADNRIEGVVITYNDVTELKRAEERTRNLASFPQLNPNPIIEMNASGSVSYINPATERILESLGMDKGEIRAFFPKDLDIILKDLEKKIDTFVNREVAVKDRIFNETIQLVPQFNAARLYAYDITKRKRADEALRASEERLKLFIEYAPASLAMFDRTMRYLSVSRRWMSDYGLDERDLRGLSHYDIFPEIPDRWKEIHRRGLAGEVVREDNDRFDRLDGSVQWLRWEVRPWHDVAGDVGGIVIFSEDITERKNAEETLRQSEERLRYHVENSPLAVIEWNADFIVTRWAGESQKIFGWSAVEIVGKPIMDLRMFFEEDIPIVQKTMEKLTDGVSRHVVSTNRNYTKDGRVIHCTWYNTVLQDAGGKIKSVMSRILDITERKLAVEALRESEARFRTLFETMTEGFSLDEIIVDDAGKPIDLRFLSINPAFERHTGLKAKDIVGRTTRELFPEAEPVWFERYGKVALTGEPVHFEERFGPLDKWFEVSAYQTEPGRFAVVFFDITERKRTEALLQHSLQRLELLSRTAGELLQIPEPQKAVESLCRKVMEYLDCHAFFNFLMDEKAGRLHLNAYAGISEEEARRIEWMDLGVAVFGFEAREGQCIIAEHIPATSDERTELVKSYGIKAYACYPILGPGGMVIGTLSFGTKNRETFSDDELSLMKAVTDQVAVAMMRMRGEQSLRLRTDELETSNKELEAFIYSVSHDLRAPLRTMAGFSKILIEEYGNKMENEPKDYLMRITNASEKMTELIDDLLRLSRISKHDMDRMDYDLSRQASSIAAGLYEADPGRSVEFSIEEGLRASVDPNLIRVALANLIENAWKFTSKKMNARIEFSAFEKEGKTVYYVRDNGAGFDQTLANKMFSPFQRLHTEKEFEGTGIGLAIVERIIRRHGGAVWAEGDVGKGATVFFTLG